MAIMYLVVEFVISNTSSALFYSNTFSGGDVNNNTFSGGNVYNNTFSGDVNRQHI
jgi:hypothetical protein